MICTSPTNLYLLLSHGDAIIIPSMASLPAGSPPAWPPCWSAAAHFSSSEKYRNTSQLISK